MFKWVKKLSLAAAVVAFGIVTASFAFAQPADLYSASYWARAEIVKAEKLNLLTDSIQGDYQAHITREEFSELIVRLYEELSGNDAPFGNENPFIDTKNPDVVSANKLGIVKGVGNGRFAPDNTATREEVAVMLFRTLKAVNPEYSINSQNQKVFSDQNMISAWAKESVGVLTSAQIINGISDNRFNPKGKTSRQEAITFIRRMYAAFSNDYIDPVVNENELISRGEKRYDKISYLKALIQNEMGKPYQWGGTGPDSYDCSGLVYTLYNKIGISLPRVSASQATSGVYVPRENLQYGDLVFFARDGKTVNHVGIYVGNGEFVHAPSTGDVVKKSTLLTGYYNNIYYTARRVMP
jgi:hypothetical protein